MGKSEELNEKMELVAAEISLNAKGSDVDASALDEELKRVDRELEKYDCQADMADYGLAVFGGIVSGIIDSLFVGDISGDISDIALSHEQVNRYIESYAKKRGYEGDGLKKSISYLEDEFKVAQDNIWSGKDIRVSTKNHHLADMAHHPTPVGLASAIVVQFFRVGTFVNRDGEWHFLMVETKKEDIIETWGPAVITGVLNWLAYFAEHKYEEETEEEVSPVLKKLIHISASMPLLIEIAKCADNWYGHLISDVGGSKNTAGGGMGIPGVFVSFFYELAALPGFKSSGLLEYTNNIYQKQKIDLRHEIGLYRGLGKQTMPVLFNEFFVRTSYFLMHLLSGISEHNGVEGIEWKRILPFDNRVVDRMMTVASLTLSTVDVADAAARAAVESAGNWVLFAGNFTTKFNYVAAGRAVFSIAKEISDDSKEAELLHEKRILTENKAVLTVESIERYKQELNEMVCTWMAEDIQSFLEAFDLMKQGLAANDSDAVIRGNVQIQRVLGKESQFESQSEFDDLMMSDIPFSL